MKCTHCKRKSHIDMQCKACDCVFCVKCIQPEIHKCTAMSLTADAERDKLADRLYSQRRIADKLTDRI